MMEHSYEDTRGPSAWYKMKRVPKHLPPHKQQELKETWPPSAPTTTSK